ncbi:hypothetical protein GALMADRAFT_213556 [Galerina marginata CBS 339.88]|uniref:Uncharacterized protein n=1 Tax=Galerina marginata (strain CBS 339.88) TaxID=685588 RepID=A0A067SWQ4_GALM3|nr:hypothetical protein GALMADRAFT_213556 [Galerina marginata CBS 339.88]
MSFSPRLKCTTRLSFDDFVTGMPNSLILHFLSFFDSDSIILVGKVSVRLRAVYRWFCNQAWNPCKVYEDWFAQSARQFRYQLHHTGAIVSGSIALQFFDRVQYPNSDMDIFVRTGGAEYICQWILCEGYRYGHDLSDTYYGQVVDAELKGANQKCVTNSSSFENAVLAVHNFTKLVGRRDGSVHLMTVQVIVVDVDPVEHVLFDFHSSAVMNFITSTEAVSIFPAATFLDRVSYICKIRAESIERCELWKSKYAKRGYRMVGAESFSESKSLPLGCRYISDRHCWVLRFMGIEDKKRPIYGPRQLNKHFDVLPRASGVVTPGSHIRIAEPYIWRCVFII